MDIVKDRALIHLGTHYGGSNQRDEGHHHHDDDDSLIVHAKKPDRDAKQNSRTLKRARAEIEAVRGEAINTGNIQWVSKKGAPFVTVNRLRLTKAIKRIVSGRLSFFTPLYEKLADNLQDSEFSSSMRFWIIATGVDPMRKKELGTFIKLVTIGREFVLPHSFLKDCRKAFTTGLPR